MTSTEPGPGAAAAVRPTRQRRAIGAVLDRVDDFRSAQQIHEVLHVEGESIGLSTVYRTLQALAETGEVDVLRTEAGEALYRACSDSHHHHLVCRRCGRTVEVAGPTVESWTRTIASAHGFREISHTFELLGVCPTCR